MDPRHHYGTKKLLSNTGPYTGGVLNLEHAISPKVVRRSFKLKDTSTSTNPKVVLKEIFELLEEYGPVWYTEELHNRAKAALSNFH